MRWCRAFATRGVGVAQSIVSRYAAFAGLFLALHFASLWTAPSIAMETSYCFLLICPLAAALACLLIRKRTIAAARWEWIALCVSLLLWEAGLAMAAYEDLLRENTYLVTAMTGFVYFSFGIPLLLALCTASKDRSSPAIVAIDGVMAVAIGVLAYSEIFSYLPGQSPVAQSPSAASITAVYDVENVSLAALASVRLLATDSNEERLFFKSLGVFLWTYSIVSALYNHMTVIHDLNAGSLLDVVIDIPFLILIVITFDAAAPAGQASQYVRRSARRLIQAGISVSLPLLLLGLGIIALAHSTAVGVVIIVGSLAGYGLRNTLFHARLLESEDALLESRRVLEIAALVDPLTGVGNRRAFDQALDREWHRAHRTQGSLGLLMIDIDFFKRMNDTYGHQRGDECLAQAAAALRRSLPRASDLVARYGGEEFACILPGTDRAGVLEVGERLRAAVAALQIEHSQSDHRFLSVSVGATACRVLAQGGLSKLIQKADEALYEAKRKGRNRVEFAVTETNAVALRAS